MQPHGAEEYGPKKGSVMAYAKPLTMQELALVTEEKLRDMAKRDRALDDRVYGRLENVSQYARRMVDRQGIDLLMVIERLSATPLRVEGEDRTSELLPPEAVAILNLMPRSSDEAVTLIPSLQVYNMDDIDRLLLSLQ